MCTKSGRSVRGSINIAAEVHRRPGDDHRPHRRVVGAVNKPVLRGVLPEHCLLERLEKRAPIMANKGRLQVGADADIVVFDPATVIDEGTFEDPARYSTGFRHVLVNGVPTLRDGQFIEGAAAGVAIRAGGN